MAKKISKDLQSRFRQPNRYVEREVSYQVEANDYIEKGMGSFYEKAENFPKYVSRQTIARYMALYEIFKQIIPIHGDVIEGGVSWGGGLMWMAQLSSMFEPVNFQRRIIGFDTFKGFPGISQKDKSVENNSEMRKGGFFADSFQDLNKCIELYDKNRFINHIQKVYLIKGDVGKTIPQFIKDNPQQIISLLHLDFDLYEPTKTALKHFLPRMPKGAVIIFDELNNLRWAGETVAVLEEFNIKAAAIKRFEFEPHISYCVL